MADIVHKHDLLARSLFLDLDTARDFLEIHLPHEVLKLCNLSSLNIESSSFIDGSLRPHYSDILYAVDLCTDEKISTVEKAYIYVLIEHQRAPEKEMPLTLFRHHLNALEKHIEKYPESRLLLPLILPIVFYNGKCLPVEIMRQRLQNVHIYH